MLLSGNALSDAGDAVETDDFDQTFSGSRQRDKIRTGSGSQFAAGGRGNDHFLSFGDAGEPDPAQTDGADGRINPAVPDGVADDVFHGGDGADTFEFVPLINATAEVIEQYQSHNTGRVNWARVAGENDNVHDHWVEGIGNDTILDFNKAQGDTIKITGHTANLVGITSGEDDGGAYSLITIKSEQGAAGAHDDDPLGTIKVYGDPVTADDVTVNAAPTYGMERLSEADRLAKDNGGGKRTINSNTDGFEFDGTGRVKDLVTTGLGSQVINAGAGNDHIVSYGDAGEPDPAQTDGADGRVNDPVDPDLADDTFRGGQGRDLFRFRPLLNAKDEILAKHTRANGSVNWRRVAGENNNVHDHWVEGIGNDTILEFSQADGDSIRIEGHTATIRSIEQGADDGGAFTLITIYSNQGGAGAHDGDDLGSIKVYGDAVTQDDITVNAGVFYGVDRLDRLDEIDNGDAIEDGLYGSTSEYFTEYSPDYEAEHTFTGSNRNDRIRAGAGQQIVLGNEGRDHLISLADAGEPDPAQTNGADGRVNDAVADGLADDIFTGGSGADTFEFVALINAKNEVLDQFRNHNSGSVNWGRVAGENDNVHDHWVEGIGNDVITDFSSSEGDRIKLTGHTMTLAGITYGEDDGGAYSLITIYSEQGAAGAHDDDPLGTIKAYGEQVTEADITITKTNYGMDRLEAADLLADDNGGGKRVVISGTDGDTFVGSGRVTDFVTLGRGSQTVDTGAGNDRFVIYGDAGEPDPAQTDGADGRVNDPIDADEANDVVRGGQGKDVFRFRPLLNAKDEIIAKHTRANGRINWRGVAGENGNVHDHWVEGIGNDTILDYSAADGDQIRIEGHTATIAEIQQGEDAGGAYTLIIIVSDQGGAGAHDGDSLGSLKVYGDAVAEADIVVKAGVFFGVDRLDWVDEHDNSDAREEGLYGDTSGEGDDDDDNVNTAVASAPAAQNPEVMALIGTNSDGEPQWASAVAEGGDDAASDDGQNQETDGLVLLVQTAV